MYTIKQAAIRSGSSVSTVRVWERRYGIVRPARTPAGYRLYDDADIDRLIAMRQLVDHQGIRPSQAAARILAGEADIPALVAQARDLLDAPDPAIPAQPVSHATEQIDSFVAAAIRLDLATMERTLDEAFAAERYESAMEHVVFPALRALGAGWADGSVDVSMEHAASELVRRRLARFFEVLGGDGGSQVIIGMPPGGRHEIGALAFAVAARRQGIHVLYLGADVPVESWVVASQASRIRMAVIGVVDPDDVRAAGDVIDAFGAIDRSMPLALGGPRSDQVVGRATTFVLPVPLDAAVAAVRAFLPEVSPAPAR